MIDFQMKYLNPVLCFVIIAALAACQPADKNITIGYVQFTQDPALDAARAGVFRALADSGFVDSQNIKVLDNNAQGDFSMINTILQSLLSQNADLIITNSTPCMVAAAQTVRNIPVVYTVAYSPDQIGMKTTPGNLNGVYDPLNVEGFVDLMMECIPDLKRIGIPYNNAEPNAEYSTKVLSREFSRRGLTVVTASVTSANDILQAGQYLAGQKIDAFVASADNTVYLGLPALAKLASAEKIPLFVTDPLQPELGAAIGLGADYYQWGYQAGLLAVDILKGRSSSGNRIEPIRNYNLIINQQACTEQGLQVPETVTGRATRIINKISDL